MEPIVVVGAGIGGLTAAADLASRGLPVVVLERGERIGGKMRVLDVAGRSIDVGPTVLTMRWVFDELFADAGSRLDAHVELRACEILARHAFGPRPEDRLDLFVDVERSADAVGRFAGARAADGYRRYAAYAERIFAAVEGPFLRSDKPTLTSSLRAVLRGSRLDHVDGLRTMHEALRGFFDDPRLLQLFGRYATYAGSSPYSAPATLHVIAHVERLGVHRVVGGMHRLAEALVGLAVRGGAVVRTGAGVERVVVEGGRAVAVELENGERIAAGAVVLNAESAALADGLLGPAVRRAVDPPGERSLSAFTLAGVAHVEGFPLEHHNVAFGPSAEAEFDDLFRARRFPRAGTVYLCAADRPGGGPANARGEPVFLVANAPPCRSNPPATATDEEIDACTRTVLDTLARSGLRLRAETPLVPSTPKDFAARFPGSQGSLYGPSSHGPWAAFGRASARTRIPRLYLVGGSAHPGAGVPMVALSGRLAAKHVRADLASTSRSRPVAMPGGISTP